MHELDLFTLDKISICPYCSNVYYEKFQTSCLCNEITICPDCCEKERLIRNVLSIKYLYRISKKVQD